MLDFETWIVSPRSGISIVKNSRMEKLFSINLSEIIIHFNIPIFKTAASSELVNQISNSSESISWFTNFIGLKTLHLSWIFCEVFRKACYVTERWEKILSFSPHIKWKKWLISITLRNLFIPSCFHILKHINFHFFSSFFVSIINHMIRSLHFPSNIKNLVSSWIIRSYNSDSFNISLCSLWCQKIWNIRLRISLVFQIFYFIPNSFSLEEFCCCVNIQKYALIKIFDINRIARPNNQVEFLNISLIPSIKKLWQSTDLFVVLFKQYFLENSCDEIE